MVDFRKPGHIYRYNGSYYLYLIYSNKTVSCEFR